MASLLVLGSFQGAARLFVSGCGSADGGLSWALGGLLLRHIAAYL